MNKITRATTKIFREQLATNPIKNVAAQKKLEILVDGKSTYVEYEKDGNTYHLLHSFVPNELQGHGLGHILAQRVFTYIAQNDLKMKIVCEFLESAMQTQGNKYKKYIVP